MGGHGGSVLEFESLLRDDGSKFVKAHINPREDLVVLPYSSGLCRSLIHKSLPVTCLILNERKLTFFFHFNLCKTV